MRELVDAAAPGRYAQALLNQEQLPEVRQFQNLLYAT